MNECKKRAWLAVLFTMFGGIMSGYFYLRLYKRGLIMLGLLFAIIIIPSIILISYSNILDTVNEYYTDELLDNYFDDILPIMFGFIMVIICAIALVIFAIIDVYRLTKKYNQTRTISEQLGLKRVWLSVLLSIFGPGLGHWYVFKYNIGIVFFLIPTVLYSVIDISTDMTVNLILVISAVSLHAFTVFDAYRRTKRFNQDVEVIN